MLKNYLKTAIRNILRSKIFSFINILGMAVSLSVCLIVIQMIITMYTCDKFHENKDSIYRVKSFAEGYEFATAPLPLASIL